MIEDPPVSTGTGTGTGTITTELRANTLGLPGVLMQGIATISPGFSQLASFTSTVALAAVVAPIAFLFGGIVLTIQALATGQIAREFPSAGGWYTWVARTLHPRAGFFAGWVMLLWLPPIGSLVLGYLGKAFLEPAIQSYYGVDIPWWVYPVVGVALVAAASYRGIRVSERLLIILGLIEIVVMVALAVTGLADPGKGGFTTSPINPGQISKAPDMFLAIVFAVFAFSGWEAIGPVAEESKNPRRLIPLSLVGAVLLLMVYEFVVTWGNLVGAGVDHVATIPTAAAWPVATFAQRVWSDGWLVLAFALFNSALGVTLGSFNGGTRTFFAMGRSGVLPAALGKVSPHRKTPDNAIHLQVLVNIVALVLAFIFGVEAVFLTWAIAFTLALIVMYILADLGVIRYYLTEARARFNPFLHLLAPVFAIIAVVYVGYKSVVPLPPQPEKWAPIVTAAYFVIGAAYLGWLHLTGRRRWMSDSQAFMADMGEAPE